MLPSVIENIQRGGYAHRSGSFSEYTLRFVWSRMLRILVKQPISSLAARNWDMTAVGGLVVTIKVDRPTMRLHPNSEVHPGAARFAPISAAPSPPSTIHLPEVES